MFTYRLTDDAELRPVEEHHAEAIYATVDANREHLRPWLPWVDKNRSVADTLEWVRRSNEKFAKNEGITAGIWVSGRPVGVIGNVYVNWESRKTEIGYWIAADAQGRGIVTAAARAMTEHAIRGWQLNRVEIRASVENRRSRAVAERLGFVLEGTLRQAGRCNARFEDHAIYGMLAQDWLGNAAAAGS